MKIFCALGILLASGLLASGQVAAPKQKPEPKPIAVPAGVTAVYDLPYVLNGTERQTLDLYVPQQVPGDKLPLLVWIHGGGYQRGSKTDCPLVKNGFVDRGYAVASMNYRLTGTDSFPAQIEDCKAAVRWLRANAGKYGIDARRVVVWGSSAGGALSQFLGVTGDVKKYDVGENLQFSSAVQAVVNYYGGGDYRDIGNNLTPRNLAPGSTFEKYIGGPVRENKEKAAEASPIVYVSKKSAPTYILHGAADKTVPVERGVLMREALEKAGAVAKLMTIAGADHGGKEFWTKAVLDEIDAFIREAFVKAGQTAAPKQKPEPKPIAVPAGVTAFRDLPYVANGHARQKLDLFVPAHKAGDKLPLVIWVHGGGWQMGSKEGCFALKAKFTERGYAIASVGYRLTDAAVFPAQIEDCKAAVRWLRANAEKYDLDARRFAAWGSSAGGHLVLLLGVTGDERKFDVGENLEFSSAVRVVIDYFGPSDFCDEAIMGKNFVGTVSVVGKLLGCDAREDKAKAAAASPICYVSKNSAPTYLFHGTADKSVLTAQSVKMHAALEKAGVVTKLKLFEGAAHGGPWIGQKETLDEVDGFIREAFAKVK